MGQDNPFQGPWNFLGLPEDVSTPARARAWVLPVPYEGTTCYGAGTRNGPAAIIAASRPMELFDREFDCKPAVRLGVHTMSPLAPVRRSPDAMLDVLESAVAEILARPHAPQVLAVLGGEHTISAGAVRGLARHAGTDDLVAVQIDAHADLWDRYEGSTYSHACAVRRIVEVCPVFQIGIRNIGAEEEAFRRTSPRVKTVFAEDMAGGNYLAELGEFVRGKRVYLTIDLDGLDPSIMPAVGTPEPGGISWECTLDVVRTVCRHAARVPVFDVVELAPIPGLHACDFLAAKLAFKCVGYFVDGHTS